MKQLIRVLTLVLFTCTVTVAWAGPQDCKEPPGQQKEKNKPHKVTILHCGCPDAGDEMFYVEIQVSSKSKGHLKHAEAPTVASCEVDSDIYMDFSRNGPDCQVEGEDYLDECLSDDQYVGALCGAKISGQG